MDEVEREKKEQRTIRSTFHIDHLPNPFKIAYLPEQVQDWIAGRGFDFVSVCSYSGEIIYLTPSVKNVLSYASSELIGEKALDYFAPKDRETIEQNFICNTKKVQNFSVAVRNLTDKFIWVDVAIASIYVSEISDIVFITLVKDITDKKESEELLIRSEKMSVAGQLAAGVAHEIRNPLTSLKGFIQLLQAGVEQKEQFYQIMIDEIEKIDTISSELLFIGKPITDKRELEKLSKMINEIVTLLNTQAKRYHITITTSVPKNISLLCDRTQIKQVLINLVKNAIEAMPNGGNISIDATTNEDWCYVSIIDQGTGIPEYLIHKINEPFFTTKPDGTGLGLMISNKIIENHQGKLSIESTELEGSTFTIQLPCFNNQKKVSDSQAY
ncbi:sporulation kinase A [Paraliobacillus ryukyuensis]|uniref:histidine kinase n=1 Tax=Paraliobacillus ryukyuensis TaxID=200904 RepID=A0A366EIZ8_9BACI|nr:ATP-binding protein [Paraliobacillus ryukyuensis]RBP01700.1 two-component system sporulation sensor kinase A [Paraliobacillus ryukyuensis]